MILNFNRGRRPACTTESDSGRSGQQRQPGDVGTALGARRSVDDGTIDVCMLPPPDLAELPERGLERGSRPAQARPQYPASPRPPRRGHSHRSPLAGAGRWRSHRRNADRGQGGAPGSSSDRSGSRKSRMTLLASTARGPMKIVHLSDIHVWRYTWDPRRLMGHALSE